jgi:hypothetical protein
MLSLGSKEPCHLGEINFEEKIAIYFELALLTWTK